MASLPFLSTEENISSLRQQPTTASVPYSGSTHPNVPLSVEDHYKRYLGFCERLGIPAASYVSWHICGGDRLRAA